MQWQYKNTDPVIIAGILAWQSHFFTHQNGMYLEMTIYYSPYNISLTCHDITPDLYSHIRNLFSNFPDFIGNRVNNLDKNNYTGMLYVNCDYEQQNLLLLLINELSKKLPDFSEIYRQVKTLARLETVMEKVNDYLANKNYDAAFQIAKQAQDEHDYDLIFSIAESLFSALRNLMQPASTTFNDEIFSKISNEIYQMLNLISTKDPHYEGAQSLLFEYTLLIKPEDEEHELELLEKKFKCALNAGHMVEARYLLAELCGNNIMDKTFETCDSAADMLCTLALSVRAKNLEKRDGVVRRPSENQLGIFRSPSSEANNPESTFLAKTQP